MLPTPIKLLLNLFDFFGFFTESSPSNCMQNVRYVCSVLLLIFFKIFNYNVPVSFTFAVRLNTHMQYYGGLFTHTVIYIDGIIHRREQRIFWKYFQKFRDLSENNLYKWNSPIIMITSLSIIFLLHMLLSVWDQSSKDQVIIITAVVVTRIYHIRIIQYVTYMEIVRANIEMMRLRTIEATVLRGVVKELLKEVRVIHQMTIVMVDCFNTIFGYSQFEVVLFCFFLLLTDLNWGYLNFNTTDWINMACEYIFVGDFVTNERFIIIDKSIQ